MAGWLPFLNRSSLETWLNEGYTWFKYTLNYKHNDDSLYFI